MEKDNTKEVSKMEIYIFDKDDTRRASIFEEFEKLRIADPHLQRFISICKRYKQLYNTQDIYHISNLVPEETLVLLHLGYRDNDKGYGNNKSIPYYEEMLSGKKIAVIAYTGGDEQSCPIPEEFEPTVDGETWHIYLHRINSASDLRLAPFLKAWSKSYPSPPPCEHLRPNQHCNLIAFSILCQGYLAATRCDLLPGCQSLPDELKNGIDKNWAEKYKNQESTWWDIIKLPEAMAEIKNEWSEYSADNDLVSQLLENIANGSLIQPEDVSNAYSQLCSRLSQS